MPKINIVDALDEFDEEMDLEYDSYLEAFTFEEYLAEMREEND